MCCKSQTNVPPRRRRVRESVTETLSRMKIELECVRHIYHKFIIYLETILFYTDDDDLAAGVALWTTTMIYAGVCDRACVYYK